MAQMATKKIQRPLGLTEEVYRRIRSDIMSLKLQPDTRILLDALSQELGVSQTPIREALSMLEANGLVVRRHFSGYCTAPRMDRTQLDELFEFRLLVEPHAARRAAEKMTDEGIRALKTAGASRVGGTDPSKAAELDTDFHKIIAEESGNKLIAEALEHLHIHVHIFRSCFLSNDIIKAAASEHAEIVKALRNRDAAGAENAMRRHIQRTHKRLASLISRSDE